MDFCHACGKVVFETLYVVRSTGAVAFHLEPRGLAFACQSWLVGENAELVEQIPAPEYHEGDCGMCVLRLQQGLFHVMLCLNSGWVEHDLDVHGGCVEEAEQVLLLAISQKLVVCFPEPSAGLRACRCPKCAIVVAERRV